MRGTDEERVIISDVLKSNGGDIVSETLVPGMGWLLLTIERFLQEAYIIWVMRTTETRWVMHIDSFMNINMWKGIMNI